LITLCNLRLKRASAARTIRINQYKQVTTPLSSSCHGDHSNKIQCAAAISIDYHRRRVAEKHEHKGTKTCFRHHFKSPRYGKEEAPRCEEGGWHECDSATNKQPLRDL